MTQEPRSKRVRAVDKGPCGEFHNPGRWPYVAACVLDSRHKGNHMDKEANEWPRDSNGHVPTQRRVS